MENILKVGNLIELTEDYYSPDGKGSWNYKIPNEYSSLKLKYKKGTQMYILYNYKDSVIRICLKEDLGKLKRPFTDVFLYRPKPFVGKVIEENTGITLNTEFLGRYKQILGKELIFKGYVLTGALAGKGIYVDNKEEIKKIKENLDDNSWYFPFGKDFPHYNVWEDWFVEYSNLSKEEIKEIRKSVKHLRHGCVESFSYYDKNGIGWRTHNILSKV